MALPAGCPLDPREFADAWPAGFGGGWVSKRHGDPSLNVFQLTRCGCEVCLERLGELDPDALGRVRERIAAATPKRVDVTPAREHLRRLMASGRSLTSIAAEAGVDKTTLVRAMRPDVKRLHVKTVAAVLAVGPVGVSPALR